MQAMHQSTPEIQYPQILTFSGAPEPIPNTPVSTRTRHFLPLTVTCAIFKIKMALVHSNLEGKKKNN